MNEVIKSRNETTLARLNLVLTKQIKDDVLHCQDKYSNDVVLKFVHGPELLVHQNILPLVVKKYSQSFKRLIIPKLLNTDSETWILTPFYEGKHYNEAWNEREPGKVGGIGLGLELSKEMAEVISDLLLIDTVPILNSDTAKKIEKFRFDFNDWLQTFVSRSKDLVAKNLLTNGQVDKALGILGNGFGKERLMFSNGDYYPRNLINNGEKIVLVDWQGWDKDWRINYIDQVENIIAIAYIHMWFNFGWQRNFIHELNKFFKIDFKEFQKALLIKSFDQAYGWRESPDLSLFQMQIFCNALNESFPDTTG